MSAKKQFAGGEQADDSEQVRIPEPTHSGDTVQADSGQIPSGPAKEDATAKSADPPRKADPAPKIDAKPQAKAKSKGEAEAVSAAKPEKPKSLAEVMKVDLRVRKRRRF
jgi:hypothetical protein